MSAPGAPDDTPLLELDAAAVWVPTPPARRYLLQDVSWQVRPGEHWALLGRNGAGKTTLLSLASGHRHPSSGTVAILGARLGRVDVRTLWGVVGHVDATAPLADQPLRSFVAAGATGTPRPLREPDAALRDRVRQLLELVGLADQADASMATRSHGERARARLARALVPQPRLLLLDEPDAGLDLPGRELLAATLARLAEEVPGLATVVVAHHLEQLPRTTTHALLLHDGRTLEQGPVGSTLTGDTLSACFGLPLEVSRTAGRWSARVT